MTTKIGKALVVGSGISGIRAALDLAEYGYGVTLIDRSPHIGGILSQLDYQFPTDRCGMCKMLPLVNRDAGSQYCLRRGLFHENIEILLSTELIAVEGEAGHFQVTLQQHPNWVDSARCTGCGECAAQCPVEVPDDFNAGLSKRKAIYLPIPHAIPNSYVIDFAACSRCGACVDACPTGAIELPEEERKKFHVLVVDDELVVRDSLKEWLENEGFAVEMAASGSEALDQLTQSDYRLMLLDIKMPGMDGVEVLQKARESFPDLNVIMMTAYATVETAVEAMKIGALDYLVKPFDPETLVPMVLRIYQNFAATEGRQLEVGALVLCGGTGFFNPASGKNTFGYKTYPNVVTSLEFERMLSGTGPHAGRLVRPSDSKAVHRIAWIQCVGSRDIQLAADFCSNVCCMVAIKEAVAAKEKIHPDLEATIFYMDMRTFEKTFQRYRDQAERIHGVRFERARVHSLVPDATGGDLLLRSVDISGKPREVPFDMVVLPVGQRPAAENAELAEMLGIELNSAGFGQTAPFSLTCTSHNGIFLGGSFAGLKGIGDSVIQSSAAALNASRVIHSAGGSLAVNLPTAPSAADFTCEVPKILVVVCSCGERLKQRVEPQMIETHLRSDPLVDRIEFIEQVCTATGWQGLVERVKKCNPNRLLIGACLPCVYKRKLQELGRQVGLDPALMEVVDTNTEFKGKDSPSVHILSALKMGIAKLKWVEPEPVAGVAVVQRALVVGGGIAGMSAALAISDHGFEVDLVEQSKDLGGNLSWLQRTLEGHRPQALLEEFSTRVKKHPKICVHTQSRVVHSSGEVGNFHSTIEGPQNALQTLAHGATILATGGSEAVSAAYGYGTHPAIISQKELEQKLADHTLDPEQLNSVVMIQCVDSREEPRNYCSRVCCANALKHALYLKEQNSAIKVYILYRDLMSYGFAEAYYTRARRANVTFIQYQVDQKPLVYPAKERLAVTVFEPIIGRQVQIEADRVVLATGVVPDIPRELVEMFGATLDPDGFFQEAEPKWRPVDSLKEGVFACGLAHSPRNISESITTAEAASQRVLRILSHERIPASKVIASVRHSLCSLCERCIDACPYGARTIDYENEKVQVNPLMCQGCGLCATACPNSASVLQGFQGQQMFEIIDAALG